MHADDWQYLSEGGLHVIFRYTGSDAALINKALRVRKLVASSSSHADAAFLSFLSSALGSDLLPAQTSVQVSSTFLAGLQHRLEQSDRPDHRLDALDPNQSSVVLVEDLVSHGVAVEIKPKWGKVPPVDARDRIHPLKSVLCRHCAHATLKIADRIVEEHNSSYCPLDLYSSSATARARALDTLLDLHDLDKAGNNLRVFASSKKIDLTIEQRAALRAHLNLALHRSSALSRLRHLQSAYDPLDIELVPEARTSERKRAEPSPEEWAAFAQRWLTSEASATERPEDELRWAYTMSAIFKDCSIFICFPDLSLDEIGLRRDDVESVVRIIDLDPKPLSKFDKWKEQDRQIWAEAQRWYEGIGPAVDVRRCIEE